MKQKDALLILLCGTCLVALLFCGTLLLILYGGEPDLIDALIYYLANGPLE